MKSMMDCLYAKCTPMITDWYRNTLSPLSSSHSPLSVMAELEKLGRKYRVALRYVTILKFINSFFSVTNLHSLMRE